METVAVVLTALATVAAGLAAWFSWRAAVASEEMAKRSGGPRQSRG